MALTEYVVMPGQHYINICDAVRSKTGQGGDLVSGDIPGAIRSISTGSGDGIVLPYIPAEELGDSTSLIQGKKLYGQNGEVISGNIPVANYYIDDQAEFGYSNDSKIFGFFCYLDKRTVLENEGFIQLSSSCEPLGDAKPEHVLSGYMFSSKEGVRIKGEYIPSNEGGVTLEPIPAGQEGTSEDLISGKKLYNSLGEIVQGGIVPGHYIDHNAKFWSNSANEINLYVQAPSGGITAISPGQLIDLYYPCDDKLGTAGPDQVLKGYTFTSKDGVNVSGRLEVNDLESGEGITDFKDYIEGTKSAIVNDQITSVATSIFQNTHVQEIDFKNCITIGTSSFREANKLKSVSLPKCSTIGNYAFYQDKSLINIEIPSVKTIYAYAFKNCQLINNLDFLNLTTISTQAFMGCTFLSDLTIRTTTIPTAAADFLTDTAIANQKGYIYVPSELVENYKNDANWKQYANQIRPIEPTIVCPTNKQIFTLGETREYELKLKFFDSIPKIEFFDFGYYQAELKEITNDKVKFTVTATEIKEEDVVFLMAATVNDKYYSGYFYMNVYSQNPTSYTVDKIGEYGFDLSEDGYYINNNKHQDSSVAVSRININTTQQRELILECSNSSEFNYDYGLISKLDISLKTSGTDNALNVLYSFQNNISEEPLIFSYTIPTGTHFVDIKYQKDSSVNKNQDTFKFKIRLE